MSLNDADQVPECVSVQDNINQGPAVIPCRQSLHLVLPCTITKQRHDDVIISQVNLQAAAETTTQRAVWLLAKMCNSYKLDPGLLQLQELS